MGAERRRAEDRRDDGRYVFNAGIAVSGSKVSCARLVEPLRIQG